MVGHLEQTRTQQRRAREHPGLSRQLRITGQQRHTAGMADPQHQRRVVGLARRILEGAARRWTDDLDEGSAQLELLPGHRMLDRNAPFGDQLPDLVRLGQVGRDRVLPERVDGNGPQHGRDTADVVEMRVRDHQQVEVVDSALTQPSGRTIVAAGVDEDPRAVLGLHEDRVTLTDIDRGDDQPRDRWDPRRQHDGEGQHHRDRSGHEAGPTRRPRQPRDEDDRCQQE